MTKSTRHLLVLVSAVVVLAMAFAAVGSALAQEGGQNSSLVIQDGDSLGDVLERYPFTDDQIRQFFATNSDLVVETGETITFPEGVVVNTDMGGTTGDTTTGDQAGAQATAAPSTAGDQAGEITQANFVCAADQAVAGETYVTEEGDTLGVLLAMMGFDFNTLNQQGQAGIGANNEVIDFVHLNCDIDLVDGQTVTLPAGIPLTGTDAGQTGQATAVPTATVVTDQQAVQPTATPSDQQAVQPTATPAAGTDTTGATGQQNTTYTVQSGETLIDIATRLGITLEELVRLNPDLVTAGETINIPAQQGSIPQTGTGTDQSGQQQDRSYTTVEGDTLGTILDRYNFTGRNLHEFLSENEDLVLVSGQQVTIPEGLTIDGEAVTVQNSTTEDGDTLGDLFDEIGYDFDTDLTADNEADFNTSWNAWINANRDLQLVAGQVVEVPASIPQTGAGTDQQSQQAGQANQQQGGEQIAVTGEGVRVADPFAPSLNLHLTNDYSLQKGRGIYIVRSGDTLSSIANRIGADEQDILALNTGIPQNGQLLRGQRLIVPACECPGVWQNHLLDNTGAVINDANDNQ